MCTFEKYHMAHKMPNFFLILVNAYEHFCKGGSFIVEQDEMDTETDGREKFISLYK